jgi:hypothetical protein
MEYARPRQPIVVVDNEKIVAGFNNPAQSGVKAQNIGDRIVLDEAQP